MEETTTPAAPKSGAWKVLGIIGVVFGGLSILFAFIPCVGVYAIATGSIATIVSIVALVLANSAKASKTLAIIGLVLSLASVGIGYWQYHTLKAGVDQLKDKYGDQLKEIQKDVQKDVQKDLDSANKAN